MLYAEPPKRDQPVCRAQRGGDMPGISQSSRGHARAPAMVESVLMVYVDVDAGEDDVSVLEKKSRKGGLSGHSPCDWHGSTRD